MKTRRTLASLAVLAAVLALAACGGGSPAPKVTAAAPAATAAPPATAAPAITCADINTDLDTVVSDLKSMDAKLQEAWVSGGDSGDLQALINDTQQANANAGDTLDTDAATFNSDASSYLSDNSPGLYPGWQTGYGQVTSDIDTLARDCGQPTAPANNPANS